MKLYKITFFILLFVTGFFSSCISYLSYIGDTLPPTNNVDVYYDAKDVKKAYKVIGHISAPSSTYNERDAKFEIIEKAKKVGSDGVIIVGMDFTGGKDSSPYYKADAIKYND
ncbi:MAG: hypothetical protein EOP42_27880 [Sphingobacteriaceae bacterium]|nr:MAG: hypothetical protein EOP42_27880 [Sphingobacteriaceae bacterium]